jgi:hypothetical protein
MGTLPLDTEGMTNAEVSELANAYLDLLRLMVAALEDCQTKYGYFSLSEHGFMITGHPPEELIDAIITKHQEGHKT